MSPTPDAMLIVESGMADVDHVPLTGDVCVLGKSQDADITIDEIFVSRRHCKIRFQDQSFYISDLGSKNGTYVNDVRLHGGLELSQRSDDDHGLLGIQLQRSCRGRASFNVDRSNEPDDTAEERGLHLCAVQSH